MSFDWSKFVVLGEELPSQYKGGAGMEAALRSAVSRMYYGFFHQIRQRLLQDVPSPQFANSKDIHQDVTQHLKTVRKSRECRQLAEQLGRLRSYRNSADYDDRIDNPGQWHSFAVGSADRIKKAIDNL